MTDIIDIYKKERGLEDDIANEVIENDPKFLGFRDAFNNQPRAPPIFFSSKIFYNTGYTLGEIVYEEHKHNNQN